MIFVLHHFPGECIHFNGSEYAAIDGIPRVMRLMVNALAQSGQYQVKVTARRDQMKNFAGFFQSEAKKQVEIVCLEDLVDQKVPLISFLRRVLPLPRSWDNPPGVAPVFQPPQTPIDRKAILNPSYNRIEKVLMSLVYGGWALLLNPLILAALTLRPLRRFIKTRSFGAASYLEFVARNLGVFEFRLGPLFLVNKINARFPSSVVLIPHYHLFPEALQLDVRTVMYIPDFTPHFFEATGEFGPHQQESAVGQALVRKTRAVITNSDYSRSYLPETRLQVPAEKINMFYLPNLNPEKNSALNDKEEVHSALASEIEKFKSALQKHEFLFYPTQPRQNKRLDFLFSVFDSLCKDYPKLRLVLTNYLVPGSTFESAYQKMKYKENVLFIPNVSDQGLSWLYQRASALVFTSAMEGNFPPQVFEALYHRLPVVATRLPLITERLEGISDQLLLCDLEDKSSFVQFLKRCLADRAAVIEMQEPVREKILLQGDPNRFNSEVLGLFARATQ